MKPIFVAFILSSVFVQTLFCIFDDQLIPTSNAGEEVSVTPRFQYELSQQYFRKKIEIVETWSKCSNVFQVPYDEARVIFLNPPLDDDQRHVSRNAKCLVDCVLRKTGVMSDSGFDEIEYLSHIKQLRYNYTTFDIHKKSIREQRRVMEIISKRASNLPRYIARPLDFHDHFICRIYRKVFRNTCYDLIQSYALAARNCKNLRDTDDDRCETSWMVMRCMMMDNRKRFFDSPFYPVQATMRLNY